MSKKRTIDAFFSKEPKKQRISQDEPVRFKNPYNDESMLKNPSRKKHPNTKHIHSKY